MATQKPSVKPGNLKPFFPFADMPPEYVIISAKFAKRVRFEHQDVVFDSTSEEPYDYFLVDGKVNATCADGSVITFASGAPEAAQPVSQYSDNLHRVQSEGTATLVRLPQEVIKRVCAEAPEKESEFEGDITLDITQSREFFNDFKEELRMNRVRLPSLPGSASRVRSFITRTKLTEDKLISAVSIDPAITAKLVKMANSSLFSSMEKVDDHRAIIGRLGLYSTREIAACFAFRDVYKDAPPELLRRLETQVHAARQVSAMAAAIADDTDTIDPNVAAVAGLLHNVGALPIFSYSMQHIPYAMNPKLVDRAIRKLGTRTGALLAKKWRYSEQIVRSIEHSQDWSYPAGDAPDLANVVLAARYHYELSRSGLRAIPKPRDVPSIGSATLGRFDEKHSLRILNRAKELIHGQEIDRKAS